MSGFGTEITKLEMGYCSGKKASEAKDSIKFKTRARSVKYVKILVCSMEVPGVITANNRT